jgi:hypothetical protein
MLKYNENHYQIIWWICMVVVMLGAHICDTDKPLGFFLVVLGVMPMLLLRVISFVNLPYDTLIIMSSCVMVLGTIMITFGHQVQEQIPDLYQDPAMLIGSGAYGIVGGLIFACLFRALFLKDVNEPVADE